MGRKPPGQPSVDANQQQQQQQQAPGQTPSQTTGQLSATAATQGIVFDIFSSIDYFSTNIASIKISSYVSRSKTKII